MHSGINPNWNAGRRLDAVEGFSGQLTFLIPHEWIENDDDDTNNYYSYVNPELPGAWFRASVITVANADKPGERLRQSFAKRPHVMEPETGNFVHRSEKDIIEEGDELHIVNWVVGNVVEPHTVRKAVFSYAVLADKMETRAVLRELELVDKLVRRARFA